MILFSIAWASRPQIQVDLLLEVVVLDVNATHGALKLVHTLEEQEDLGSPKNCGYAGMEAHPTAGVDLYVVELASGKLERFTVYQAVRDEAEFQMEPLVPCTPHATSVSVLEAAKARMAQVRLDPEKKPRPSEDAVSHAGRTVRFLSGVQEVTDDDTMSRTHTWTVTRDGTPVHRGSLQHTTVMGTQGELKSHGVWAVPNGVVMLEHWYVFHGRGGATNQLAFTPVLALE